MSFYLIINILIKRSCPFQKSVPRCPRMKNTSLYIFGSRVYIVPRFLGMKNIILYVLCVSHVFCEVILGMISPEIGLRYIIVLLKFNDEFMFFLIETASRWY